MSLSRNPHVSLVYFGTNDFSAQVLEALVAIPDFTVVGVVTQPDRPVGRNQEIAHPPVKVVAEKLGLSVVQPESLKNFSPASLPQADIFVVFAYGLLIPKAILHLPSHGTINIHPSLLPKYRGPTPVQSAIINGETETGVSIMLLDEQMDHGPILEQIKVAIDPEDTTETLTHKLIAQATPLLLTTTSAWIEKKIAPRPQNHAEATYCKMLTREDGKVDWNKSANEIYNLYRGLTPWPGIWTTWEGKRLKLQKIKKTPPQRDPAHGGTKNQKNNVTIEQLSNAAGAITAFENRIFVVASNGLIEVTELQLEGKKPMDAKTFLTGYHNFAGSKLE